MAPAGKRGWIGVLLMVLLLTAPGVGGVLAGGPPDEIKAEIQSRLAGNEAGRSALPSREALAFPAEAKKFYARRGFHPAWSDSEGPTPAATSLRDVLRKASRHGLVPEAYHLISIESLLSERGFFFNRKPLPADKAAQLDVLLTDAFFLYAAHLSTGCVAPDKANVQWHVSRRKLPNLPATLEQALKSEKIEAVLESLAPSGPCYTRLMAALQEYREIERHGGWPVVPAGGRLREGDRSERVPALRQRLGLPPRPAFLEESEENRNRFDQPLTAVVKAFQQRHGLTADGIVDSATLEALNTPVTARIRQLEINLERLRWLPEDLGERLVIVNIPEFRLRVLERGTEVLSSRIVVGRYATNTPVFNSRILHFELNPYWNVPRSIAAGEILPQIQQNIEYLNWMDMKVIAGTRTVPPWTIDWERLTPRTFNLQLRQDPGPKNPLGRIKFFFPNSFDVYLHDTPNRHLFEQEKRSFSHGCIRVENPEELAVTLLGGSPGKSRQGILAAMETGQTRLIRLPQPVSIYILYFTAWADAEGAVQFRKDIYKQDEPLAEILEKRGAASG